MNKGSFIRVTFLGAMILALCSTLLSPQANAVTYGSTVADPTISAPWAVSIWNSPDNDEAHAEFTCSGTLISPHTVLTAAHCTLYPGAYFVKVKSQALNDDTPFTTVSGVWANPRYDAKTFINDIGLLKLDEDFSNITYPSLANAQAAKSINAKSNFQLYGWGIDQAGQDADLLKSAKLNLQDVQAAKDYKSSFNAKTMISAGRKIIAENVWSGACNGDSGGPLTTKINGLIVVAGVTSWGEKGCNSQKPTVFSRVSYYYGDIQNGLKSVELKSSVVNRTAPVATTNPEITGNLTTNGSLVCDPGQWKNSVSTSITWTLPKRLIGTTSSSIRVLTSDAGQIFSCTVIISTKSGTIVRKVLTKQSANAPILTAQPAISGVDLSAPVTAGSTLRCDNWNWDGPVDTEELVQWFLTSQANPPAPINGQLVGKGRTLALDANLISQLKGRFVTCDVTGVRNGFSVDGITSIKLNPLDGPTISSVNVSGSSLSLGSSLTCLFNASQSATKIDIAWGTSPDGLSLAVFPGITGNVLQISRSVIQQGAGKVLGCLVKVSNSAGQAQRIGVASAPFPTPPAAPVVSISNSGAISANSYLSCSAQAGSGYYGQLAYQWGITSAANSTNFIGSIIGTSYSLSMNANLLNQGAGNYITCIATATNDAGSTSGASSIFIPTTVLPLPTPVTPVFQSEKASINSTTVAISIPYFAGFDPAKMILVMTFTSPSGSCSANNSISVVPTTVTCAGLALSTRYTATLMLSYISSSSSGNSYSQPLTFTTGKSALPTTPPSVLNFSQSYTGYPAISPDSATVVSLAASGLDIRFVAQDSTVPVTSAKAQLLGPNGQVVASGSATFQGGNNQDGVWKASLAIPISTPPGSYAVQAAASDGYNTSLWIGLGNVTITEVTLLPSLVPVFGNLTSSASGFTVQIANYNANYVWASSASSGTSSISSTGLVTVTSLSAGGTSTLTVSTTRMGYKPASAAISGSSSTPALPIFGAPTINSVTSNSIVVIQPARPNGWDSSWQMIAQVYSNDQATLLGASSPGSYYTPGASLSVVANNVGGITPDTNLQVRFAVYDSTLSRYSYGPFIQFHTSSLAATISSLGSIPAPTTIGNSYANQIVLNAPILGNISGYSASFTWSVKTVTTSGSVVSNLPANTGNQIFITGLSAGTTYNIYLTATDSSGSNKSSSALVANTQTAADTQAPVIDSGGITGVPQSLYENEKITVNVPISDNLGVSSVVVRVSQLTFNLTKISGTSTSGIWSGTTSMNYKQGASDGYLQPGVYSLSITATDAAGNFSTSGSPSFILGWQANGATIATANASSASGTLYPGGSIKIDANILAYNQTISAVRFTSDGSNLNKTGLLSEVSGNSYNKNFSTTFTIAPNQTPGSYTINLVAETANGRSSAAFSVIVLVSPVPAPQSLAAVTETYFTGSVQNRCTPPECQTVRATWGAVYWEAFTTNAKTLSLSATNGSKTYLAPDRNLGGPSPESSQTQQAFDYGNGMKKWGSFIMISPSTPPGDYVATWTAIDSSGLSAQFSAGTFTVLP